MELATKYAGVRLLVNTTLRGLIPPLTAVERAGLEKSLVENGFDRDRGKIIAWGDTIVDGHNRYEICQGQNASGLIIGLSEEDIKRVSFEDENEAEIWIICNQFDRRNLAPIDRGLLALELEDRLKSQAKKRQGARNDLEQNIPEMLPESGGETRDALGELAGMSGRNISKVKKISEDAPDLIPEIRKGNESINSAERTVKKRKKKKDKEQRRAAAAEAMLGVEFDKRLRVLHGGFEEILADEREDSVDLVFTDPPYPKEDLHLWPKLGKFALDHLKPGRFLLAYSGHQFLPEVIRSLEEAGLTYYWSCAILNTHGQARHFQKQAWISWKPLLIFSKGDPAEHEWFVDVIAEGDKDTKEHHKWAQPVSQAEYFIEGFSFVGETVVDPMCGSATIPIAAYKLDRYGVGCELKEERYNEARRKIIELASEASTKVVS